MTKKLKEIPNTAVNTKTQEEYDKLMRIYEEAGWKWDRGQHPTEGDYWHRDEEDTCVEIGDGFRCDNQGYLQNNQFDIISFDEFLKEQGLVGDKEKKRWFIRRELMKGLKKLGWDDNATCFGSVIGTIEYSFPELEIAQLLKVAQSIKQNKMNKLTKTQKRVLNKDQQAMVKAGYKRDNLELTGKGGKVLKQLVAQDYEKKLAEEAKEELKELKED